MTPTRNGKTKGFTLIEFVLYFGLMSIVMTAVVAFAIDVIRSRNKSWIVSEVEQNARVSVLRVLRGVRRADSLNVSGSTFNDDNGVLSLQMAATSTNPTVFDLSGGVLRIKEGSASATPLTSADVEVTKLRFSRDNLSSGSRAITVELGVRYATVNPDPLFNYQVSASGTAVIRKH